MNVLIAEDDEPIARFLNKACEEAGYSPQIVSDGSEALRLARNFHFDLILLDVMLPKIDGLEVARQLRAYEISSFILMITARDTIEDKIAGLDAGGDDYVCKPFRLNEILARMRALLRRVPPSITSTLRVGDLILDPLTRLARRGNKIIHLSATEYALLEYLMRQDGQVCTRNHILENVWQYDFGGRDNVVDVYIGYLRLKIDKGFDKTLIHTVRGVGFRLGLEP